MAMSLNWPELPVEQWQPTRDTVHLWTQIVGKTRLALAPRLNHWWGCTLYVTARGLTTSLMPYAAVRTASDPDASLLGFLESTFQAAYRTASWPGPGA